MRLRSFILIMLSLLVVIAAERYNCIQADTDGNEPNRTYIQQDESPCQEAMNYLHNSKYADIPYNSNNIGLNHNNYHNYGSSKLKCFIYLLSGIDKNQKEISKINHSFLYYQPRYNLVEHYIYALRHILV